MTHPPLKTTTLRELKSIACISGYGQLAENLGAGYGDDTPITMLQILASNGLKHALWALGRVAGPTGTRVCHLAACAFFDAVAHLATDPRSHEVVRVKRLWFEDKATDEELDTARAAAWAAVLAADEAAAIAEGAVEEAAAWAAARVARDAAEAAAGAAARAAAWAAARSTWAAAYAAEAAAQVAILRGLIEEYSQ